MNERGQAAGAPSQSWVAWLDLAASEARAAADRIGELLDPAQAAVSVFETASGSWRIAIDLLEAPDETALRALVGACAGPEAADTLVVGPVATRDWVAASLAGLTPVGAGRFVVHGAHDRGRLPAHRIAIEIEAALAFGTGHHGTTRGCLLILDRLLRQSRPPQRILDVGTGTGVLAIAAARAMHRRVLASDIDPIAVRIARANARANGAGALVRTVQAPGVSTQKIAAADGYDLIFANILLRPLMRMAGGIARLLRPGGIVVLSGLLTAQANAALAAYRWQGLGLKDRVDLEGWTTLCLRRPQKKRPGMRSSRAGFRRRSSKN